LGSSIWLRDLRMVFGLLIVGALSFHALPVPHSVPRTARTRQTAACAAWTTSSSGLKFTDDKIGDGDQVSKGAKVQFSYTSRVVEGKELDGNTINIQLGEVNLLPGWEEGLLGMQAGGKRRLHIPPALWGTASNAKELGVEEDDVLEFDFELLECKSKSILEIAGVADNQANRYLGGAILVIGLYEGFLALQGGQ